MSFIPKASYFCSLIFCPMMSWLHTLERENSSGQELAAGTEYLHVTEPDRGAVTTLQRRFRHASLQSNPFMSVSLALVILVLTGQQPPESDNDLWVPLPLFSMKSGVRTLAYSPTRTGKCTLARTKWTQKVLPETRAHTS
jgi:hypothetical protein